MTTRCEDLKSDAAALIYGELDDSLQEAYRAHAAGCPECGPFIEQLLLTRKMTATAAQPTPSKAMDAAILAAARAHCDAVADGAGAARAPMTDAPLPLRTSPVSSFLSSLRSVLTAPAFATAMVAGMVLLITVFIADRLPSPERTKEDALSLMKSEPAPAATTTPIPQEETPSPSSIAPKEEAVVSASEDEDAVEKKASEPQEMLPERRRTFKKAKPDVKPTRDVLSGPPFSEAPASRTGRSNTGGRARRSAPEPKASRGSPTFAPPPPASAKKSASPPNGASLDAEMAEGAPSLPPVLGAIDDADESMAMEKEAPASPSPVVKGVAPHAPVDDYERAMTAYNRGDCQGATDAFEKVIRFPNRYPDKTTRAMLHLGLCEKRRGRCSRAVGWFDKVIDNHPHSSERPQALLEAARCYRRLGQDRKARMLLEKLRRIPGWADEANQELDNF